MDRRWYREDRIKKQEERDRRPFPLFCSDVTDDDLKRGISSEKTLLESENPAGADPAEGLKNSV